MTFPHDYYERVYAGVLGKIIGVYLGRPFEGWTYEKIMANFGEIETYVNDRHDLPLRNHQIVVTDDDISGTFTFLRALADYNNSIDLTPAQIGQTWLNYIIENRTILWWGGLGNSTEHTAYLRLKDGISAPQSGSMALNGKVVAEQIGAQIFIDGWGLISPGDPALAVDFARRAASVSHDGEAIYGAQVIAALIAQAFIEPNVNNLLDTAISFIPNDSIIYRLIADLRNWHTANPTDWHAARAKLERHYGYHLFGGNCHIVPNHGLVILSLIYSNGDFSKAQTIVNTCGWDTDCNAANIGCILGVRNGLSAFDNTNFRVPVADRLYLPTADGGRAISDAVRETDFTLQSAYAMRGKTWATPKNGARFHFSLPGSIQGFHTQDNSIALNNTPHPSLPKERVLTIHYRFNPNGMSALCTPTFIPPEAIDMPGYELLASPTVYPGQIIQAELLSNTDNAKPVKVGIVIHCYDEKDNLIPSYGPVTELFPGASTLLKWQVPDLGGVPIAQVGLSVSSDESNAGILYLDHLTWDGSPNITFCKSTNSGQMWKRQWVNAVDCFTDEFGEAYCVIQNRGRGMVITGTREWTNYSVQAVITPYLVKTFGLAGCVQGQERYYALLFSSPKKIKLIKRLDGEIVLAEQSFDWQYGTPYEMQLDVLNDQIRALVNGNVLFVIDDPTHPLVVGGIALVSEEGRIGTDAVRIRPITSAYSF